MNKINKGISIIIYIHTYTVSSTNTAHGSAVINTGLKTDQYLVLMTPVTSDSSIFPHQKHQELDFKIGNIFPTQ